MNRVLIHCPEKRGRNSVVSTRATLAILTLLLLVPPASRAQAQPKGVATPVNFSADDLAKWSVYSPLPAAARDQANEVSLNGEWELAEAKGGFSAGTPDLSGLEWKRVRLPATVQYALFQAGAAPNPWYGDNWKKLQWIHGRDWYLRRNFQVPSNWAGRHIRLRFDGMDYTGVVWLDQKFLGVHEGMFGGPTFDITDAVKPGSTHELLVRLFHEADATVLDSSGSRAMKSCAVDGCWYIWGNKFRSIGLWQPVRLISSGTAYMEAPYVRTQAIANNVASLWAQAILINTGTTQFEGRIQARIVDLTTGEAVWSNEMAQAVPPGTSYWERTIELPNPRLWWPNGMGGQPLYRLDLALLDGQHHADSVSSRFGVRSIELRRNPYLASKPRTNPGKPSWLSDLGFLYGKHEEGLWGRTDSAPTTSTIEDEAMVNADESYRFLFLVNGRPMYVKGVAWLTSDDLLTLTPQREAWMIHGARDAGINLFRLNGGNDLFETEQFYNLCDENGILVWQELPVTWAGKMSVPLATWREQLKQSVLRIRQHPSLAIYVGGNEFQPYRQPLAPYLGIAREIFAAYDDRPFRMSSPGGGTYHAYGTPERGFKDLWPGDPNGYVSLYDEAVNFVSEWSYWAYGNMSQFKRIAPKQELAGGPVGYDAKKFLETHPTIHEHTDWGEVDMLAQMVQNKSSWFGDLGKASLEDFIEYSQMAQAEVYGYVFEHWRSQFPYKGGEILWTYNLHGPGSSWQIIDWFGQPHIAYYAIKRANEPLHVMANTHSLTWAAGDIFHASVYAVNDASEELPGTRITARLLDRAMNLVVRKDWTVNVPGGGSRSETEELSWQIPEHTPESYFFLLVTAADVGGRPLSQQTYSLRVVNLPTDAEARRKRLEGADPLAKSGPWLKPQIESVPTTLSAEVVQVKAAGPELEATVVVKNTGTKPAYPVRLAALPDAYSAVWSDNYFWLDPGDRVEVRARIRTDMTGIDLVSNPKVTTSSDMILEISAWNARALQLKVAGITP